MDYDLTYLILQVIICSFGLLGNIIVIGFILVLREHQKSVTQWYVINLAVADTLFLITLPLRVYETVQNEMWELPEWLCKAKETIMFLNYYSSILFLAVMSLDRYIAVCHSFSASLQKLRKRFSAFAITCLIWVVSFLLCIPIIMSAFKLTSGESCQCGYDFNVLAQDKCNLKLHCAQSFVTYTRPAYCPNNTQLEDYESIYENSGDLFDYHIEPRTKRFSDGLEEYFHFLDPSLIENFIEPSCVAFLEPWGYHAFFVYNFLALFLLPLFIMILCYGLIIRRLSKSQVSCPNLPARDPSIKRRKSSSSGHKRIRVTVMCATLVSSFIVCWLPYHAIHLSNINGIKRTEGTICETLKKLGPLLGVLNSALNPYLYTFMGTNFAKKWRSANRTFKVTFRGRQTSTSALVSDSKRKRIGRSSSSTANNKTPFTKKTCR